MSARFSQDQRNAGGQSLMLRAAALALRRPDLQLRIQALSGRAQMAGGIPLLLLLKDVPQLSVDPNDRRRRAPL